MSVTAQAADGTVHQFPDGTDPTVVDRVMKQYAQAHAPAAVAAKPNPVVDALRSYGSGLAKGVAGVADMAATFVPGINAVERLTTGGNPMTVNPLHPVGNLFQRLATPADYTPQTAAGQVAHTLGAFTPAAAMPGSMGARVANVFAPALGSEAAARIAHAMGASPEVEGAARTAGALVGGAAGSLRVSPSAMVARASPTLDDLTAARDAAYQKVDAAGVQYKPDAVSDMATTIKADLAGARFDPDFHPVVAKVVQKLESKVKDGWSPSLSELDDLRKFVRENAVEGQSNTEARLGNKVIAGIDNFIQGAAPDQVDHGSAQDAASLLANARDLHTRVTKVEAVNDALDKAGIQAGRAGSGGNIDNATRQKMSRLLDTIPNLTDEENAALRGVVLGGKGQNLLRMVGKLSPTTGAVMAGGHTAATLGFGPLGSVPGVVGLVSKLAADKMTQGKVQSLIDLIAAGGKGAKAPPVVTAEPPLLSAPNPFAGVPAVLGAAVPLATAQPARD